MRRIVIPELLDTDSGTAEEISASLVDLRFINGWFGGIRTTRILIGQVARTIHASDLSVLEVAAGAGDVARGARTALHGRGVRLEITLLDRARSHLSNGARNGIRSVAGDALALPFADASFDVVSCCLFAHHLSPEELPRFVSESLRVCRVAVLINDLVRHPLHLGLVYASLPIYRSRITRHDTVASVRRAYTVEEVRELVGRTQAAQVEIRRHFLFRMGVIAWKGNHAHESRRD